MAAKEDKNVFGSPWDDSDIVLLVEGEELHVHRSILTLQSPVFKSMFDDHSKEASEDKIPLEEKSIESMVVFLKILYPSSMFGEARDLLNDENWLSLLALAEEYQCVKLIKQCIGEIKITSENVLQILPYAVRYHESALPKMFEIIKWCAPTAKLEELLPRLEDQEISSTSKMLLTKCRFLESLVVDMQQVIIRLMRDFLKQNASVSEKKLSKNQKHYNKYGWSGDSTDGDFRCIHRVRIWDIDKTKSCNECNHKYKEKFIFPFPSCRNAEEVFKLLLKGHDIASAVEKLK